MNPSRHGKPGRSHRCALLLQWLGYWAECQPCCPEHFGRWEFIYPGLFDVTQLLPLHPFCLDSKANLGLRLCEAAFRINVLDKQPTHLAVASAADAPARQLSNISSDLS